MQDSSREYEENERRSDIQSKDSFCLKMLDLFLNLYIYIYVFMRVYSIKIMYRRHVTNYIMLL